MEQVVDKIDKLIGIVVLYKVPLKDSITITSINNSLKAISMEMDIVVYDNSPISEIQSETVFIWGQLRIHYFHDASNPGISKAYNFSVKYGKEKLNKNWILLLDQDTFFPALAIEEYIKSIDEYPGQVLFVPLLKTDNGIYSPSRYYLKRGFIQKKIKTGIVSIKNRTILNSGSMINIEVYLGIGGYNEKIKLYFSDFNFIDRYRKVYRYFVVINLVCLHELSDLTNVALEESIARFEDYCQDSYYSSESTLDIAFLFITVLLRAIKLTLKYKNTKFFQIFYNTYINS